MGGILLAWKDLSLEGGMLNKDIRTEGKVGTWWHREGGATWEQWPCISPCTEAAINNEAKYEVIGINGQIR